jgi:hypothetical protein
LLPVSPVFIIPESRIQCKWNRPAGRAEKARSSDLAHFLGWYDKNWENDLISCYNNTVEAARAGRAAAEAAS